MYYAVKCNTNGQVVETLSEAFNDSKKCLEAARAAFGSAGALQFAQSRLILR